MKIKNFWVGLLIATLYVTSLGIVWKMGNLDGNKEGLKMGVDMYHQICYNGEPPTLMFNDSGTVVICAPLTEVPQEEVKKLKPET